MYDKLDKNYIDKLPEKTNANLELSYDSSIYFACKYLIDKKFGIRTLTKKKTNEQFFHEITNFESVKVDNSLIDADKKLKKQFDLLKRQKKESDPHIKSKQSVSMNTSKTEQSIHRIKATKSTMGGKSLVRKTKKITAKKSTRK